MAITDADGGVARPSMVNRSVEGTEMHMPTIRRRPGQGLAAGAILAVLTVLGGLLVVRTAPRAESLFDLSDGAAWLPSAGVGGVSLLDGASGSVVTTLAVADPGDDYGVVEWGTDALVVNRTAGTVGRLDGATWTIETGLVKFSDGGTPLDLVVSRDAGWLVRPGSVAPLDLESLSARNPLPVSASYSDGVVDAAGALLYASADPGTPVRRIAPSGDSSDVDELTGPVAFADLGDSIAAVDLSDRSVWLSEHGVVCDGLELPAGAALHTAGADGALIVVADSGGIMAWYPEDQGCPDSDSFWSVEPARFAEPAVTDGWAAIADTDRGEVIVLDLERGEFVARAVLEGVADGSDVELRAENGLVWFNDPSTEAAGLIRRDGSILTILKYDLSAGDGLVAAPISDDDENAPIEVAGIQTERDGGESSTEPTVPPAPEDASTTETTAPEPDAPATTTPNTTPSTTSPQSTSPQSTLPQGTGPDVTGPDLTTPDSLAPPTTGDGTTSTTEDPGSTSSTTTEPPSPVEVRLAATATEAAVGDTITFQALVDNGDPTSFDFSTSPATADPEPASTPGVITYRFPSAGRHQVSVEACDDDGNCDTATVAVTIVAGAVTHRAIIADPGIVTAGDPVQFLSVSQGEGIQALSWRFGGDASPSTSAADAPTVVWSTPGTKTVELTIQGNGCAPEENCSQAMLDLDTTTLSVTVVEQAPPYDISVSGPTSVEVGQRVTYVASTTDAAGLPSPHWNVQGTGDLSNRGAELDVTWPSAGVYVVSVSTEGGASGGAGQTTVTVTEPIPEATLAISCSPTTLTAGETANCSVGAADNVSGASWQVNFPNPSAGSASGGSIRYDEAGTVTVRRVGTHSITGDPVVSNTVTLSFGGAVVPAPEVSLSGPSVLDTGQNGTWTATNSGGQIDDYAWSVSSGNLNVAGNGQSASRTFGNAGSYTITLSVTGPGGTSQDSITVQVSDPPPQVTLTLGCDASSLTSGTYAHCGVTGDRTAFTGYSWSITQPDPNEYSSWSGGAGLMDVVSFVPGVVSLTVTATHQASGQSVTSNTVSVTYSDPVEEAAPSISISGPTMVEVGQAATYSFTNSGGAITSIDWQAGGQSPGSGQTYTVTWNSPTQVTLVVAVSGPGGTSSDSLVVTVNSPPSTTVSIGTVPDGGTTIATLPPDPGVTVPIEPGG